MSWVSSMDSRSLLELKASRFFAEKLESLVDEDKDDKESVSLAMKGCLAKCRIHR